LRRERFKLDLFEKRFKVFSGARTFLSQIMREGQLKDLNPLWEYRAAIGEATLFFLMKTFRLTLKKFISER
jgi:hypothetical protein